MARYSLHRERRTGQSQSRRFLLSSLLAIVQFCLPSSFSLNDAFLAVATHACLRLRKMTMNLANTHSTTRSTTHPPPIHLPSPHSIHPRHTSPISSSTVLLTYHNIILIRLLCFPGVPFVSHPSTIHLPSFPSPSHSSTEASSTAFLAVANSPRSATSFGSPPTWHKLRQKRRQTMLGSE